MTSGWVWAVGGAVVGATIPFTGLAMKGANWRLLDEGLAPGDDVLALLQRWGRLHSIRAALDLAGLAVLAVAALMG